MPKVKLVQGRTYSTTMRNPFTHKVFPVHFWKNTGAEVFVSDRDMKMMEIQAGIKRGILKVIEESKTEAIVAQ